MSDWITSLERIANALEELVEVQKTEPLTKIIHPSSTREWFPHPHEGECDDPFCEKVGPHPTHKETK